MINQGSKCLRRIGGFFFFFLGVLDSLVLLWDLRGGKKPSSQERVYKKLTKTVTLYYKVQMVPTARKQENDRGARPLRPRARPLYLA